MNSSGVAHAAHAEVQLIGHGLVEYSQAVCASVRPSRRLRRLNAAAERSTNRFTNGVRLTTPGSANRVPITRSTVLACEPVDHPDDVLHPGWPSASNVANTAGPLQASGVLDAGLDRRALAE